MHKLWFRDVKIEPLNVKCMFIIWRRSMLFRRRPYIVIRELKQILLQQQRELQKSNRFRLAKQQLRTWITPFCIFLCRGCTTTTWNFLFSRFVEDVNTRQQFSFSFSELWYTHLEFNSRKIHCYLPNWTRWSKRHKVWSNVNILFKWRFCSRRRRCFLRSLLLG